jgi:hypothetical protein
MPIEKLLEMTIARSNKKFWDVHHKYTKAMDTERKLASKLKKKTDEIESLRKELLELDAKKPKQTVFYVCTYNGYDIFSTDKHKLHCFAIKIDHPEIYTPLMGRRDIKKHIDRL